MSNEPKQPAKPARYQSPPPITRPELRAAFKAHGIDPRRSTLEDRETARQLPAQRDPRREPEVREPAPPWVGELLAPILERLAEREEDRRGRRDSIADATERATDATALTVQATTDAAALFGKLSKWWKLAAVVACIVCTAGASCGSAVFGYISSSKAAAENTKGVATEAAKEAVKEAPKPVERERVIYVERAAAPLPSGSVYVPQIPEGAPKP